MINSYILSFINISISCKLDIFEIYYLGNFMNIPSKNIYEFISSNYVQERMNI